MTAPQTTSASYEVGYRKPPRHTQFHKGQSGNPGGRPRRPARRLEDLALYEAYRATVVMEDGRAVPMPAIQAVLRSQLKSAAGGNVRAQRDILAMIRDIEVVRSIFGPFESGGADDGVDDIDDADAIYADDNDVDAAADADRDDAGGADEDEPTPQRADEHPPLKGEGRIAEGDPGWGGGGAGDDEVKKLGKRLRRPQSAPRSRKTPRPRRPGGSLRFRPAQEAGSGEACCPAAMVPNGAQVSSPHGRSPDGAAAVGRSTPAKSGRRSREVRGARRAGPIPDPAWPRMQAGTLAHRPPCQTRRKIENSLLNSLFSGNIAASRNDTNLGRPHADSYEDRPLAERCILGFNSGPPMTPGAYNNNVELFQGPGYVAIVNEMIHDTRIVPLDGRPHGHVPLWRGDSRGHWEGDTLVVDTINFKRETSFPNSGANMHLVEKFTRTDADTLMYEFTIDDPSVWTRPFTAVVPMRKSDQPIYEYACHEGNYAMASILAGARAAEKAADANASK